MNIPAATLPYILYQRTHLDMHKPFSKFCTRLGYHIPILYKPLVVLRTKLYGDIIRAEFQKSMEDEFQELRPYIPSGDVRIIDIGAGIGGIDVLLFQHYRDAGNKAHVTLVDKTAVDNQIWYGFTEAGSFYNSLEYGDEFMRANGVPPESLSLLQPEAFEATCPQAELIISLISWGYHYPVQTYLDTVQHCLRPGGVLIIDVRDPDGREQLERVFGPAEVISKNTNMTRLKFTKPQ